MTKLITRFAPSPTGNLHIGSARTALINFIVSEQNPSSKFYLRIEDTDKSRSKPEFTQNILNGLKWLDIKWEQDVQIQSKRIKRHQNIAKYLLDKNYAYKCICTEEKLSQKRKLLIKNKDRSKKLCTECKSNSQIQKLSEDYVIRIKIPNEGKVEINDIIQGKVVVNNEELDDFILLRKDGTPTYMLSVVVDDNDLGVNLIIRGDDHLNNAFRQFYIYKFLNWDIPKYAHMPLIHGEDGSKLSKRHGAVDIMEFKKEGYLKEALINNLILLGWSPGNNELINIKEIIRLFEIKKLSKSSSIFSYDKLNFFNNHYLRDENGYKNFEYFCENDDYLKNLLNKDRNKMIKIFEAYKKELKNLKELVKISETYFNNKIETNKNETFKQEFINIFDDFKKNIGQIEKWEKENIQKCIENFIKLKEIKFPILGKPVRYLLINSYNGPSISDIFNILGKKDSIDRLNQYIEKK